ncbi:hypothetical protein TWF694_009845 [Orbilia ellipsospora]|uniref:tyrosinase n=1 Tax=Orbilia ellipsospora TaxID=2528407 RepID=A0AAV9XET0_9PEZI
MDDKPFVDRPQKRTIRWISATILSICILLVIVATGKFVVPSNEQLLDLIYPITSSPDSLFAEATAQPDFDLDDEDEDEDPLEKRQNGFFIVTGITGNGIQLRQEWKTFAADADLLNLYLCGLEAMQAMDQNDRESYFQIAGIHGAPFVPWDNVDGPNTGTGYCTHASILFPSWHRPYLAAYEQILGGIMQNLASEYPAGAVRNRYQAAANRFRLPYWDWASDASVPDIIGNQPQVTVEKPQGFVKINNPMMSYSFHPFSTSFFPDNPFNSWAQTVRQPDANGNSQPAEVNRQMLANQDSLRNRVFNILNYERNYNIFSNKAWDGGNSDNQDSIESIHDSVHGIVGGNGHMAVVYASGHDPLFMLHHCNVDRIFAIWQTLNPDSYTTSQVSLFGTRTIEAGSTENVGTDLKPFHRTQSAFWTSALVKNHTVFWYNYPELSDMGTVPDYRLRSRLRIRIQALYGSSAPQSTLRDTATSKRALQNRAGNTPQLVRDKKYHEWTTNVRINKYVTPGSYLINIFIGEPTKGLLWTDDPNFVGSFYIFSMNGTCHGCAPKSIITGSVPLTKLLIACAKQGHINDLTPNSVIPYLKDNLTWRVQMTDGSALDPAEIKSLKISVSAAEVTIPAGLNQDAPISKWVTYSDITDKKPAGLCIDDTD